MELAGESASSLNFFSSKWFTYTLYLVGKKERKKFTQPNRQTELV